MFDSPIPKARMGIPKFPYGIMDCLQMTPTAAKDKTTFSNLIIILPLLIA